MNCPDCGKELVPVGPGGSYAIGNLITTGQTYACGEPSDTNGHVWAWLDPPTILMKDVT